MPPRWVAARPRSDARRPAEATIATTRSSSSRQRARRMPEADAGELKRHRRDDLAQSGVGTCGVVERVGVRCRLDAARDARHERIREKHPDGHADDDPGRDDGRPGAEEPVAESFRGMADRPQARDGPGDVANAHQACPDRAECEVARGREQVEHADDAGGRDGARTAATAATTPSPRPRRRMIPHSPPSTAHARITAVAVAPATRKATKAAAIAAAHTARTRLRSPTIANGTTDSSSITPRCGRNAPTIAMITASAANTPALAISSGRRAPPERGSATIWRRAGTTAERTGSDRNAIAADREHPYRKQCPLGHPSVPSRAEPGHRAFSPPRLAAPCLPGGTSECSPCSLPSRRIGSPESDITVFVVLLRKFRCRIQRSHSFRYEATCNFPDTPGDVPGFVAGHKRQPGGSIAKNGNGQPARPAVRISSRTSGASPAACRP